MRVPDGFVVEADGARDLVSGVAATVAETLGFFGGLGSAAVAVRSSAVGEDSPRRSMAGCYETRLRVTEDRLVDTIVEVSRGGQIPVLVQRMVEGPWGGVVFSCDPVSGEPAGLVEWSPRGAQAVTANTGFVEALAAERLSDGSYRLPPDGEPFLGDVFETVAKARGVFDCEVDVEWMLDPRGRVWVLQVRPVTWPEQKRAAGGDRAFVNPVTLDGVPLSGGTARGPLVRLASGGGARRGGIVAAHSLRLDQLGLLTAADGLVVTDPSVLSHVAIRARELGIPAVGGVRSVATELDEGVLVEIDGNAGTVRVERTLGLLNTRPSRHFFDPWEMVFVEHGGVRCVVDLTDPLWVYSERPLQSEHRSRVRGLLDRFGVAREIQFDERTAWLPGDNSPSIVFTQWEAWRQVSQQPQLTSFLNVAVRACAELEAVGVIRLADEIGTRAGRAFQTSIDHVELVEAGSEEHAPSAVSHMAEARLLHGTLLGTVVVDILAAKALNNNKDDQTRLDGFVQAVSGIKNRDLVGHDTAGQPIIEYALVDRMYRVPVLKKLAVAYQW